MKASLAVVPLAVLLPVLLSAQSDPLTGESQWIDLEIDGNAAYPYCINSSGEIAGSYEVDAVSHGFLRSPDGTYETFDISGSSAPYITAINTGGAITGSYQDATGTHGFIRNPDGTVVSFDAPNSGGAYGTEPIAINDAGIVVGTIGDSYSPLFFLRHTDGSFEEFDPNILFGSPTADPTGLNNSGAIAGTAGSYPLYAFVIKPDGKLLTLENIGEEPGAETYNVRINQSGILTGTYFLFGQTDQQGFIKQIGTPLVPFSFPNAVITAPAAINSHGVIAGSYFIIGAYSGFLRNPRGGIVSVNAPNSYETYITGINDSGWLIGSYRDQTLGSHAFLRIPGRQP